MAKYKRQDKMRPIISIDKGAGYSIAIIMQETDKSYLLRYFREQQNNIIVISKQTGWIKKSSVNIISEIGIYYLYGEKIEIGGEYGKTRKLEFMHYVCPKCNEISSKLLSSGQFFLSTCSVCNQKSSTEDFELIYKNLIHSNENNYEEKKELKESSCPSCGKKTSEYYDEVNKIKLCEHCSIYYV